MTRRVQQNECLKHKWTWLRVPLISLTILWTIFGTVPVSEDQYCGNNAGLDSFICKPAHRAFNTFNLFHDALLVAADAGIVEEADGEEEGGLKEVSKTSGHCAHSTADLHAADFLFYTARPPGSPFGISTPAVTTPLFILFHSWKVYLS